MQHREEPTSLLDRRRTIACHFDHVPQVPQYLAEGPNDIVVSSTIKTRLPDLATGVAVLGAENRRPPLTTMATGVAVLGADTVSICSNVVTPSEPLTNHYWIN